MRPKIVEVIAVIFAILLALLLVGVCFVLVPNQSIQTSSDTRALPKIESISTQLFVGFQWISIAALIALSIVGVIFLVTHIKNMKNNVHLQMN